MPNTIKIRGSQVQSETIEASNINLSGSFDFRAASSFICANPSVDADVANKAYVDSQIGDGFQAGDGISIDTATSPDTISVNFATDGALTFIGAGTDELSVKVKSESGGSITKDADGIYIADNAIGNAKLAGSIANDKLANSTISGVSLGSNLNSISAAADGAITFTSYNGSAAVSDVSVQVDGSTLAKASNQLKVADGGIGSTQIADSAVSEAKIADGAVDSAKTTLTSEWHSLSPDGSATAFDLGHTLNGSWAYIMVFRNGLAMAQVAASPSGADEYSVSLNGGTGGVGQITFGSAPSASDNLRAFYIADSND